MKINCGRSWEAKHAALHEWHRWFAWRPVRVTENDCRWLEYVDRKGQNYCGPGYSFWTWKYRA